MSIPKIVIKPTEVKFLLEIIDTNTTSAEINPPPDGFIEKDLINTIGLYCPYEHLYKIGCRFTKLSNYDHMLDFVKTENTEKIQNIGKRFHSVNPSVVMCIYYFEEYLKTNCLSNKFIYSFDFMDENIAMVMNIAFYLKDVIDNPTKEKILEVCLDHKLPSDYIIGMFKNQSELDKVEIDLRYFAKRGTVNIPFRIPNMSLMYAVCPDIVDWMIPNNYDTNYQDPVFKETIGMKYVASGKRIPDKFIHDKTLVNYAGYSLVYYYLKFMTEIPPMWVISHEEYERIKFIHSTMCNFDGKTIEGINENDKTTFITSIKSKLNIDIEEEFDNSMNTLPKETETDTFASIFASSDSVRSKLKAETI
jgi:hypothetical protein